MLFIVMLGGKHPKAKIEVHDVVFVLADSLQQCYPQLRKQWFGSLPGMHIDSWLAVDGVAQYKLEFSAQPPKADQPKLFFINLGGYFDNVFGEDHRYILVVAEHAAAAKQQAKQQLLAGWAKPHTDAVWDLDDCLLVDEVQGRYLHLVEAAHQGIQQQNDYIVLG